MIPYVITVMQERTVAYNKVTNRFVAEASSLAFPVGRFPGQIIYKGRQFWFYKQDMTASGDDVAGMLYRHGDGPNGAEPYTELLIIND